MGYSKRQFVDAALEEIGLAVYSFDMQPEQLESCLRRLDSMLADWNGKGIRLGYPIPSSPQYSELDAETNVPDRANEAITTNLAMRIASLFGKTLMPQTLAIARDSYNTLLSYAAYPDVMQLPGSLPAGAGNKPLSGVDYPYLRPPVDKLQPGNDSFFDF